MESSCCSPSRKKKKRKRLLRKTGQSTHSQDGWEPLADRRPPALSSRRCIIQVPSHTPLPEPCFLTEPSRRAQVSPRRPRTTSGTPSGLRRASSWRTLRPPHGVRGPPCPRPFQQGGGPPPGLGSPCTLPFSPWPRSSCSHFCFRLLPLPCLLTWVVEFCCKLNLPFLREHVHGRTLRNEGKVGSLDD